VGSLKISSLTRDSPTQTSQSTGSLRLDCSRRLTHVSVGSQITPTFFLPSPPTSSPVNYSSIAPVERYPGSIHRSSAEHYAGDSTDAFAQPATPGITLHPHPQAVESTPTFVSLSSSAGSPYLLAVPNSPAFSSLVRSKKKKTGF